MGRLTAAQARALATALERFAVDDDAGGLPYGVLLSLYRADVPVLPPD